MKQEIIFSCHLFCAGNSTHSPKLRLAGVGCNNEVVKTKDFIFIFLLPYLFVITLGVDFITALHGVHMQQTKKYRN